MLRRYLAREIAAPFAAWTAFLFIMFLMMAFLRGTDVLLGSAVTLGDFARFVVFLGPQFLVQAMPIALLLAILLGLGRLSEDGELKAMQALGVAPSSFLRGPLALGLVLSLVMALLTFTLQPWGLTKVRLAANDVIRRNLVTDIHAGVFHEEVMGFTLYAERVTPGTARRAPGEGPSAQRDGEPGRWTNVLLYDGRESETPLLTVARRGAVVPSADDSLTFELEDGSVHRAARATDEYTTVAFERAGFRADVGEAYFRKNRFRSVNEELTPLELYDNARQARERGEPSRPFFAALHWRFGQIFMPLAFAFLGAPLALVRRAGGRSRGFVMTLVGVVAYYVLARTAVQFGEKGQLPVWLAGQVANVVFIGVGLALARLVERRGTA